MKVSEKQVGVMLRVLEGSLRVADSTDLNIFGYDIDTRRIIYSQLINQQSKEIVDLDPKDKLVKL